MCPPTPVPPVIDLCCTDEEEVFMSLEKHRSGCPLPTNVLADVNPYQVIPANLPEGIWYFIRPEDRKDTENGCWKAKGEACEIFSNSSIRGWRTTLEFHEGQTPSRRKTNWVMKEYNITQKGPCGNDKLKESGSLCWVFFLSEGRSSNHDMLVVLKGGERSGQGSVSESQVNNRDNILTLLAAAETIQNLPAENLPENNSLRDDFLELDDLTPPLSPVRDDFLELDDLTPPFFPLRDYLELGDLATPLSSSSSSDNSSCPSKSSDECWALPRHVEEDEANQQLEGNKANSKFSVCASVKPNEMVMYPTSSGPLTIGGPSKSSAAKTLKVEYSLPDSAIEKKLPDKAIVQKQAMTSRNVELGSKSTLKFHNGASSSSIRKAASEEEKKSIVGRMKRVKRKFMPF